jgi:lipopolysaccharide export system protein LptA
MNQKLPSRNLHLFLYICLALLPATAIALDSDKDKPINVEADKADIDEKRGISVYTGNVIVTQGSIRITSDEMTLYSKDQAIEKIIAKGNPATYKQRPEGKKEDIHAEGQQMEYYTKTDTAIFIDNAVMKQGGNTFKSNRITYDIANDKVNAGARTGGQRVTITIQPESRNPDPSSPAPVPPAPDKSPATGPQTTTQPKPLSQ